MYKTYEIKKNDITILLSGADGRGKFEFEGLIINSKPDVIFKEYISSFDESIENKTLISMRKYLFSKIKEQADKQLKEYIENNINNTDFYTEKNEYGYVFWGRQNTWHNKYPEIREDISLCLNDIGEGNILCIINNTECIFNFMKDEFTEIKKQYNNQEEKTPIDIFYGGGLNFIIAIEQYRKGIAHKGFTEIVNLNNFLEGKKSIKIKLKDGRCIELKDSYGVSASDIIEMIDGKFYINDSYSMKPRIKDRLPITELDYLQFGKNVYKINTDNLVIE